MVPLSDALSQARENAGTVVFSIVRTPERDCLYNWAGPFTKGTFVLWAPASRATTISSDADLQRYRIGAVEATVENDLLAARGVNGSRGWPTAKLRRRFSECSRRAGSTGTRRRTPPGRSSHVIAGKSETMKSFTLDVFFGEHRSATGMKERRTGAAGDESRIGRTAFGGGSAGGNDA